MSDRREEIRAGLAAVRARIEASCAAAGREPAEVSLIVITKFFPVADVRLLAELGVRDVGENRHQEAVEKVAELNDLDLRWHFVGNLQSNKAAEVAAYAAAVHSVDRAKLVRALAKGAERHDRMLDCLVQVDLADDHRPGRGGCRPDQAADLADQVAGEDRLRLRGLMAVAPLDEDPAAAFARLAELRSRLLRAHPEADWLSAGMSGDLEEAVAAGATHIRIGTAILGRRPPIT